MAEDNTGTVDITNTRVTTYPNEAIIDIESPGSRESTKETKDSEYAYHNVIEVEECSETPENNLDNDTPTMDTGCYCNCHQEGTADTNVNTLSMTTQRQLSNCNSTSLNIENSVQSSVITINEQSNQSLRTIGGEQSSTDQSNSLPNINNRTQIDDQSELRTNVNIRTPYDDQPETGTDTVKYGIDNAAFEVLRQSSIISAAGSSRGSIKPPTYSSLGEFYLHDEPPKYENITGNKLDNELEPTNQISRQSQNRSTTNTLNYKSKIAGGFILIGIILITALLVYLSVSSENADENTNNGRRN